jgi:DNA-directed RNA polymerase beta subunit
MAQTHSFNGRKRVRKFFGKIPEVAEMPNLIEVQKASYDQFLMVEDPAGGRSSLFSLFRISPALQCSNSFATNSTHQNSTLTNAVSAI